VAWYDDFIPGYPDEWNDAQADIVNSLGEYNPEFLGDERAIELIDRGFFDMDISHGERDTARAEMAFYFDEMYDIDIFDVWDWEDYRDWYDAA